MLYFSTVPASAFEEDDRKGLYISAFAGGNFEANTLSLNDGVRITSGSVVEQTFSTGLVIGGAIGYKFPINNFSGLRFELVASYRENDANSFFINITNPTVPATPNRQTTQTGDNSSFGVFANILYDSDKVSDSFIPYIGIGAGLGGVESDIVFSFGDTDVQFGGPTRTEFLYQAIAGVTTIPLSDKFDFFVDGRYYSAPGIDFDLIESNGNSRTLNSAYNNYQVQAGLRFPF